MPILSIIALFIVGGAAIWNHDLVALSAVFVGLVVGWIVGSSIQVRASSFRVSKKALDEIIERMEKEKESQD